jgi:hypothetical protein
MLLQQHQGSNVAVTHQPRNSNDGTSLSLFRLVKTIEAICRICGVGRGGHGTNP